jgi:malate dehydrogenase (oxaloacetate-decarboxylating)(NADP+)
MSEKTVKHLEVKPGLPRGYAILRDPLLNKGSAFPENERAALGLQGLLPPRVFTMEEQILRVMGNYSRKQTDLERYIHLISLQDRNETLFYRVVLDNLEQLIPILYTPTVGLACQEFGHIFRRSRGLYVSVKERGNVKAILQNWPHKEPRIIVVTDGERILGLGDQGASGMGIPIGKLSLYTGCAGIHPTSCLPVMLDVGTENEDYIKDPLYMGLRQKRVRGKEYDDFVGEFVTAVQEVMPKALIQFEDFGNTTAFHLLERWRNKVSTFNDDIQGTAAVVLAGLFSALRLTKKPLGDQRILFLGAGEAGIGIGDLIASAMVDDGMKIDDARKSCWFFDSKGLVVKGRAGLADHKLHFAHDHKQIGTFVEAIRDLRPTAIVGVSTIFKSFNQEVIETMSKLNERPIIFALSNPTSKAECTAAEAYTWSKGKAVVATGSPFPPFTFEGRTHVAGQGNNSYIFPGVGLGIVATEATRVTDRMFSEAARALAKCVLESDLEMGRIYPALNRIREVSASIAAAVAEVVFNEGLARVPRPANVLEFVKSKMWEPKYESFVK